MEPEDGEEQQAAGISVNEDEELQAARAVLGHYDLEKEDNNSGIGVYCEVVQLLLAHMSENPRKTYMRQ